MEITTSIGAAIGATVAVYLHSWVMLVLFSLVMIYSGLRMALSPERPAPVSERPGGLSFIYSDPSDGGRHSYTVDNLGSGMAMCTLAGALSSLTGVGGGAIKVPLMNVHMHVPIKVASATSSYMIGITAFSGAMVYLLHGAVLLDVAAAVAVGAFIGATIGSRVSGRIASDSLKRYMVAVYFAVATTILLKAGGIL